MKLTIDVSEEVLKKVLLAGFFVSAMFIMSSTSRILSVLDIKDKDFVKYNSNYLN